MEKVRKIPKEKAFIQMSLLLLQSPAFTHAEKIIISYILSWQKGKTVCFESNSNLCQKLHMGMTTIKDAIAKFEGMGLLYKYKETKLDIYRKPNTYRELRIDRDKLSQLLNKAEEDLAKQIIADHLAKSEKKIRKKKVSPGEDQIASTLPTIEAVTESAQLKQEPSLTKEEAYIKLRAWVKWRESENKMTSSRDYKTVESNFFMTVDHFIVTAGWVDALRPYLKDFINENLLIKSQRRMSEEEWQSRNLVSDSESDGVTHTSLFSNSF